MSYSISKFLNRNSAPVPSAAEASSAQSPSSEPSALKPRGRQTRFSYFREAVTGGARRLSSASGAQASMSVPASAASDGAGKSIRERQVDTLRQAQGADQIGAASFAKGGIRLSGSRGFVPISGQARVNVMINALAEGPQGDAMREADRARLKVSDETVASIHRLGASVARDDAKAALQSHFGAFDPAEGYKNGVNHATQTYRGLMNNDRLSTEDANRVMNSMAGGASKSDAIARLRMPLASIERRPLDQALPHAEASDFDTLLGELDEI